VARGEYVHHVGDPADELFVVASGQMKDSIVTEDGDELVHSFFGQGMPIGEPGYFATAPVVRRVRPHALCGVAGHAR
jgi:CRP-like cAMP-binding protein